MAATKRIPAKEKRREEIKQAFFAGFDAARAGSVAEAWEESPIRHAIDYADKKAERAK